MEGQVQSVRTVKRCLILWAGWIALSLLAATSCCAQATAKLEPPQASWIADLENKYPGLLEEFGRLFEKLEQNVQFPAARGASRIMPLLPESTMTYAAIPNYGDTTHQALKIFEQELQESKVLRDWWQHGEVAINGPKVEAALEKFHQASRYLGEEFVVSAAIEGKEPKVLIVAEVKKPGLKKVFQEMVAEFAGKSKASVRVLDPQELAIAKEQRPVDELLVLVRPDFVVAATDLGTLRGFNAQLDGAAQGFAATPFGKRVAQAYEGGVTLLAAADLQKVLSQVPAGKKQDQASFERSGFADMKYAVWDRTSVAGQGISEGELSFAVARRGAASWLAKPTALGSLDFVSPKAVLVGTAVLTSPAKIFDDVKEFESASNPNAFAALEQAEKGLKLSVKEDLLGCLDGEITLELDSVTAPKPEWKAILKVNEAKRLQQTLSMLFAAAQFGGEPFDQGEVTYYALRVPAGKTTMEIGYAYVDGYLVIGSSHETVVEGVRLHISGESLAKSKKFLASVPPNHSVNASAMLYQDPTAMMAIRLRQTAPEIAELWKEFGGETTPGVVYLYGEEAAIREASRGGSFDVAAVLVAAAIAIPNLLRSRIAANEASAAGSTRTVNTAEVTYQSMYPKRGFAPDLATLGPDPRGPNASSPQHSGFIDGVLANASCSGDVWCKKSGYNFRITAECKMHVCKEYVVVATPADANTGTRSFCSTSDGVIRYKTGAPLTAAVSASECRTWEILQ